MEKTSWKTLAEWKHLSSSSILKDDTVVTIKQIKKEEIVSDNGRKDRVIVCYFTDSDLPMVLNKTNCRIIEKMYGTDKIEDWIGKQIVVYKTTTKMKGETVECLRIRDYLPKPAAKIICECGCGAEITAANNMTAEEVSQYTKNKYGKKLTAKCAAKIAAEGKKDDDIK